MYVTRHAQGRMAARLGEAQARRWSAFLESAPGLPGVVAFLVATLPVPVRADDGSNGDTLAVIAVDGSVETVFLRRSTQDMSASFFGARKVVDWR